MTRLQCGSVFAWNCAGELYAIECALCEERPLCALDEFAEHMDVWHGDWQATAEAEQPEDELMMEVLAEQTETGGADNELKELLVQQLNGQEASSPPNRPPFEQVLLEPPPSLSDQVSYGLNAALPDSSSKLSTSQMQHLIELYKGEPRLWDQSHAQFRDVELCRGSWRRITAAWSAHCSRQFSVTDVRIRVSTLCQRFLKQRERLDAEGELDEGAKFVHYDQLSFLCEQQSLLNRREHYSRENKKLLEIYEHYPILWHNAHKRLRCAETMRRRQEALRGLQLALRLCGINLSTLAVQRRLQSLRKLYRLEKIRYLHSVVEGRQAEFVSSFEHYASMEFLHKHIDPYVCAVCGKIFENLVSHQSHVQSSCQKKEEEQQQQDFEVTVGEIMAQLENATEAEEEEEEQLVVKVQCAEFAYEMQLPATVEKKIEAEIEVKDEIAVAVETKIEVKADSVAEPPAAVETLTLAEACAAADLEATIDNEEEQPPPDSRDDSETEQPSPDPRLRLRLSLPQTHKLLALYKAQPCLWDPNHLDYSTRKQRRLAWQSITEQLNSNGAAAGRDRFTWQLLHRKLTDYTKYYRRERQRQAVAATTATKWSFFDAFRFLDDVLPISSELQKTLQWDSNLKIIAVYRSYAQLWCTDHPDYTKRKQRQRHVESLCTRLQEECNLQMTVERLRSRLIDFRCQFRQCKLARLAAAQRGENWTPEYEYYEPLRFLEPHVSPFGCAQCPASFKRRTDYLRHERNVHLAADAEQRQLAKRRRQRRQSANDALEHICHICGMKFSLRTSLLAHLRRHLGQRTHLCSECPKKFFNSTSLRVHLRSHTKELPYVCEHCARGFVNASKLNQHVKRHRGQRDFPCGRCDKSFYTAHERDRHIRAHLNIRDKVCPYCGRAFVVGSAYYAHLNLHRGEKRYGCESCGRRFAQYAGLYKHRKRCLPNEPLEE